MWAQFYFFWQSGLTRLNHFAIPILMLMLMDMVTKRKILLVASPDIDSCERKLFFFFFFNTVQDFCNQSNHLTPINPLMT